MSSTYCAVIIPGPKGAPGTGTPGTDGIDAFTVTTAAFTMPAVGASVVVSVENGTWAIVGMVVYVQGAGYMEVMAVGATSLTLKNLFSSADGNAAPTTIIATASQVSPAGKPGEASLVDSSTAAFPSMAAFYAADVTAIANFGVIELTGYFAAGDMGGGLFRYDQTDVTSADDGGRIIVNGTRRFKRIVAFNDPIRAEFFGAVPNTATLVQAALNTIAIRKCVAYYNRVDLLGSASYPDASATPSPLIYYIDNDIRVTNGTQIRGSGKLRTSLKVISSSVSIAARVAAAVGYFYAIVQTNVAIGGAGAIVGPIYGLPEGKSDNVVVEDLTLDCNAGGQGTARVTMQATHVEGCNFTCQHNLITGFATSTPGTPSAECFPIHALFHAATTNDTGHRIIDNEITGAASGGIYAGGYEITCIDATGTSALPARGTIIHGNYIHDIDVSASQPSSLHAISFGASNGICITGNLVKSFAGKAIYLDTGTTKNVVIADNVFLDVFYAMHLNGGSGMVLCEDWNIHDNIVKLVSSPVTIDYAASFGGWVVTSDSGMVGTLFNRILVRDNFVLGNELAQPITFATKGHWLASGDTHSSNSVTNIVQPANFMDSSAPYYVSGSGITPGTYVTAVNIPGNSLTLSAAASSSLAGTPLTFSTFPPSVTGDTHTSTTLDNLSFAAAKLVGYFVTGSGIPAGTFVVSALSATSILLSAATTTSVAGGVLTFTQKYYPHGFTLINTSETVNYSGILVDENVFEIPDVGTNSTYYFETYPYSLAGYVQYSRSYDSTKFKWGLNRNKNGKDVMATVVYDNLFRGYRLYGGSLRSETISPNEWPDDVDMAWYNSTTRTRFSAKKLFEEIASGSIANRILYQVSLPNANADVVQYNTRTVSCATTNTSPIVTVPDTTVLGLNYRVNGAGIDPRSYILEINGPTTITLSHNATATSGAVNLTFKWRAALAGYRGGQITYIATSTTATCADTTLLEPGDIIGSANVPGGTYIVSITNGTDFVMSAAALFSASDTVTITPPTGTQGNGGTFDGISAVTTFSALNPGSSTAKVYEAVAYSWQANGDRIWQSGSISTYISEAILTADRMINGHFSVIFGTADTEKFIYLPPPTTFAGREFLLVVKKGVTTTPRGIHIRCGTPGAYSTNLILAPGLQFESDATGFVSTALLTRPDSAVVLSAIRIRAIVDGSGWMLQSREYESGSKQSVNVVTVGAGLSSYTLSTTELLRELDGIVQVAFDTTDTDKTVVLPNPTGYKGRKFELIVYKAATANARRILLNNAATALIDPDTNLAVANLYVSKAQGAGLVPGCKCLLTSDGLNWFVDFHRPKALSEAFTPGFNYALTNAWANVILNGAAQTVTIPTPGVYLVTYSYGVADTVVATPLGVFGRLYDSAAAAAVAKSLMGSIPGDQDDVHSQTITKSFFFTATVPTTLTLQAYQDTTGTATIYGDYTYVGAAYQHAN